MKKDQKYYGQVWFAEKEEKKEFCVLYFQDDDLFIETNLCSKRTVYKEPQILGVITGIGYITFIDCSIQQSSSGVAEMRMYKPEYTFIGSNHLINTVDLKFKEFSIVNDTIVKWVNFYTWYDSLEEKLIKKEIKDEYKIESKGIQLTVNHYLQYSSKRTELHISNKGSISFRLKEPVDVMEAIELYDKFQKVLQLVYGGSMKFSNFSFKCLSCDGRKSIYYNDKKLTKSTHTFVHTDYEKTKKELPKILNAVYSNTNFQFCLDKLLENFISKHSSHPKRFINSISAFEAFCKIYSGIEKYNLTKYIKNYKSIFKLIGEISDDDLKVFPNKIVRSRDYHIHSNLGNKDVFSDYDLLYISFLFDFVIAYLLLSEIKVSKSLLEKYVMHGKSVFIDMKRTNEILRRNPLIKP